MEKGFPMDADTRQSEILKLLDHRDRVEVEDLATRFEVSLQTIRADLRDLSACNAYRGYMAGLSVSAQPPIAPTLNAASRMPVASLKWQQQRQI